MKRVLKNHLFFQIGHEKINFTCEPEDKEYLKDWANREGRTLSNLVERIVKEAIAKDKAEQSEQRKI